MNLYGIWIDHAHAFVVKAQPNGEMTVQEVASGVEPHFRSGTEQGEHRTLSNQHDQNNSRTNEMHAFAKTLVAMLHDAHEIAVFGPSNAKHDLKHAIEEYHPLADKLVAFETTDKMTENQLMAHVKEIFKLPRI